jgi:cell division protein FtsN
METDFIDTGKIQMADFNPINSSPSRTYELREANFEQSEIPEIKTWDELTENLSENVSVYNYQFDDQLYIPIKLDKTATVLPKAEELIPVGLAENEALIYHVIGGCFSVKSNADNLVADLTDQGYQARVLDLKGGLYRVTAGDYSDRSTAKENLKSFKNQGFSGWILKK